MRCLLFPALAVIVSASALAEPLQLPARTRVPTLPDKSGWVVKEDQRSWDPAKTGLVICDMWDTHTCPNAASRVGEIAPRVDAVAKALRAKGSLIIHCPSDTMKFYEGTPQRKLAQSAPPVEAKVPLQRWCYLDKTKEPPLPIDDSDGGCDCETTWKKGDPYPWTRQHPAIEIMEGDAVTQSEEAYYLIRQRGIEHVLICGVHLNMCVLGRPFGIRQLAAQGLEVMLLRDLTDTMYNPKMRPFVSHFAGTDLMIEHVEKHWCPTTTSAAIIGGEPYRFKDDPRKTAQQSAKSFKVNSDFAWDLVLAEPDIAQPVFLNFDERGRMWVVEYRQYPRPAGLTVISHDDYWRTVYDKVPDPPPRHVRGLDRISIHEDTDGDGTFDKHSVFLDGLSICTAAEHGRGGHFVLNPPYLLFYADGNGDDVPDADPEVLLSGFGIEDTHSVANSLRWGPDGWLYGAHGSTVTSRIVRPGLDQPDKPIAQMMGQGIWRYHPETHRFEVFAEGGGNTFGVEFDSAGRLFSGHNGGDTRGFHYVQGGYLRKGFEKHGQLSNPYAYGFFDAMDSNKTERFTHNFIVYEGGALGPKYEGKLFGIEPLQGRIVLSEITPDHSTFKTQDIDRVLTSEEKWFRPVDIKAGPDGAIYVADFYDAEVSHIKGREGFTDQTNGRVWRLRPNENWRRRSGDFSTLRKEELTKLLDDPNKWRRQMACQMLAERGWAGDFMPGPQDSLTAGGAWRSAKSQLTAMFAFMRSQQASKLAKAPSTVFMRQLESPDPVTRSWAIRWYGDQGQVDPATLGMLHSLARSESNVEVRVQLAATARRFPAKQCLPIVRELLMRDQDAEDPRQPLMLWWAIESKCANDRDEVLKIFAESPFWDHPIVRERILERLMHRFVQSGTRPELLACARLLDAAPTAEHARQLMKGFEAGVKGRSLAGLPPDLLEAIRRRNVASLPVKLRLGDPDSIPAAAKLLEDEGAKGSDQFDVLQVLADQKIPALQPVLLSLVARAGTHDIRTAALAALQMYDDPAIAKRVIALYPQLSGDSLTAAQNLLSGRPAWAEEFVHSIESGHVPASSVPAAIVAKLRLHQNPQLSASIAKLWPDASLAKTNAAEPILKRLTAAVEDLASPGDPYRGHELFAATCTGCHRFFGAGGQIGPDLTGYQRNDLNALLIAVANPSAEIREGYENHTIVTRDGRTLVGFLAEQDDKVVALRGLDGSTTHIPVAEITSRQASGVSLMPEGLLNGFEPQQVRDLIAYLRITQPLVPKRK